MRIADEGVLPVHEREREGLRADVRDRGRDVDAARALEVEVVLVGLVVDAECERTRRQMRDGAPGSVRQRDREARPDGPLQGAPSAPATPASTNPATQTPLSTRGTVMRVSYGSSARPVSSAAQLGAEPLDEGGDDAFPHDGRVVVRERPVGEPADERWIATDLRPSPTWSPR